MKKLIFLMLCFALVPETVWGQTEASSKNEETLSVKEASQTKPVRRKIDSKYRDKIAKLFNAKVYHDPYIMSEMVSTLSEQDTKSENYEDINFETFFTSKDSAQLKESAKNLDVKNNTRQSEAALQKVWEDPHEFYIDMVMNQEVPALQTEKVKEISEVDKKAISNFMMMMTEAGPDLGNQQVSIQYDSSLQ